MTPHCCRTPIISRLSQTDPLRRELCGICTPPTSRSIPGTLVALNSDLLPIYDSVISSFDELLAEHGYVREGRHYRVEQESIETLTFFCHFGITCVLLSHLWSLSPFVPLQSFCMPTSSVTEVYTEERQRGIANFRATRIGDTTHLTMAGLRTERLPHSALFTEVYSDFTQRHD